MPKEFKIDSAFFAEVIRGVVSAWHRPLITFGWSKDGVSVELLRSDPSPKSIDERIKKIDEAKERLLEGLSAIDELKSAAQTNKHELQQALAHIEALKKDRAAAEKELESIKKIATADIEAFRKVAGVPSARTLAKERWVGFILGVTASLFASALWWAGSEVVTRMKPNKAPEPTPTSVMPRAAEREAK